MLKIVESPFFPDFSKDIHYISWTPNANNVGGLCFSASGYSSLAFSYAIVSTEMQLDEKQTVDLFRTIDNASETGTLYPKANITIMPNSSYYSDEEIYQHFNDALKAQNLYVKSKNVIFDMSSYSYFNPLTKRQDNGEFFYMIQSAYRSQSILSKTGNENWFVICNKSTLQNSYRYIDFSDLIASEENYSFLKRQ